MGKKLLLLLLLCFIFSACSQTPQSLPENSEEIGMVSGGLSITGGISQKNPDAWREYEVKHLKQEDLVLVNNIVTNCQTKTGTIIYNLPIQEQIGAIRNRGYEAVLLADRKIMALVNEGYIRDENFVYGGDKRGYAEIEDQAFLNFFEEHKLRDDHLTNTLLPEYHSAFGLSEHISCSKEKGFCDALKAKNRGEKDGNVFYYGIVRDPRDGVLVYALIINQQVYLTDLNVSSSDELHDIVIETERILSDIHDTTAVFSKYRNLAFHRNKPNPFYTLIQIKNGVYYANFQLQTCEVPLIKTP